MRVLLADDDRVLTTLLSNGLRARGVVPIVAHDSMQAFMVAMRSPPDVIVLDVQMPGGTGLDALKKLKSSAKTSQIPVVVLSGSIEPTASDLIKNLGAIELLLKPIEADALYEVLCGVLGRTT